MEPATTAALIGAASSFFGGSSSNKTSAYDRLKDQYSAQAAKDENDRQYDLARNSIKYRVEDAKNSGIHPLYALGAQTMSSAFQTPQLSQGAPVQKKSTMGRIASAVSGAYEAQIQAKNLEAMDASINLTRAQTMDVIQQAKMASNIARTNQTGRTMGNPTALKVAGKKITKSKNWSDAQDIEDRYGDLVSWLYGIGVVTADGKLTLEGMQTPRKSNKPYGTAERPFGTIRPYKGY